MPSKFSSKRLDPVALDRRPLAEPIGKHRRRRSGRDRFDQQLRLAVVLGRDLDGGGSVAGKAGPGARLVAEVARLGTGTPLPGTAGMNETSVSSPAASGAAAVARSVAAAVAGHLDAGGDRRRACRSSVGRGPRSRRRGPSGPPAASTSPTARPWPPETRPRATARCRTEPSTPATPLASIWVFGVDRYARTEQDAVPGFGADGGGIDGPLSRPPGRRPPAIRRGRTSRYRPCR